jgi:hypothetical protein
VLLSLSAAEAAPSAPELIARVPRPVRASSVGLIGRLARCRGRDSHGPCFFVCPDLALSRPICSNSLRRLRPILARPQIVLSYPIAHKPDF